VIACSFHYDQQKRAGFAKTWDHSEAMIAYTFAKVLLKSLESIRCILAGSQAEMEV